MAARAITLAGVLGLLSGTAALAQVGASVTLKTDDRYRARSLSDGRPVASLNLSYDRAGGSYLGGSVTSVLSGEDGPGLLRAHAYAGYARKLESGPIVDVGIIGYGYSRRYLNNRNDEFVEVYAGLSRNGVSGYVRLAPNYFEAGPPVIYVDVAAVRSVAPGWRLNAGVGVALKTTDRPGFGDRDARYDLRVGATREFETLEVSGEFTFGGPGGDAYFDGRASGRSAFVLSVTRSF